MRPVYDDGLSITFGIGVVITLDHCAIKEYTTRLEDIELEIGCQIDPGSDSAEIGKEIDDRVLGAVT
jgi:hypothetical protein